MKLIGRSDAEITAYATRHLIRCLFARSRSAGQHREPSVEAKEHSHGDCQDANLQLPELHDKFDSGGVNVWQLEALLTNTRVSGYSDHVCRNQVPVRMDIDGLTLIGRAYARTFGGAFKKG